MSTKHSDGPWDIDADGCVVAPFGEATIAVAHVFQTPHAQETAAANLLLIRAAPELYETLRDFAEQYRCGCGHPHCNNCERDRDAHRVLSSAIPATPGGKPARDV